LAIPLRTNEGWRPTSPAKEHARPKETQSAGSRSSTWVASRWWFPFQDGPCPASAGLSFLAGATNRRARIALVRKNARAFRECHSTFEASPFRQPEGRGFFFATSASGGFQTETLPTWRAGASCKRLRPAERCRGPRLATTCWAAGHDQLANATLAAGLTDNDWAKINPLRHLHESGGLQGAIKGVRRAGSRPDQLCAHYERFLSRYGTREDQRRSGGSRHDRGRRARTNPEACGLRQATLRRRIVLSMGPGPDAVIRRPVRLE
jgi:hypothetical protein